jgi:hypothetical protein
MTTDDPIDPPAPSRDAVMVLDPTTPATGDRRPAPRTGPHPTRPTRLAAAPRRRWPSRRELAVGFAASALSTYCGGVVLFVLHARVRQEAGPHIGDPAHWLLDSTLAFLALTPVAVAVYTWATRRWGVRPRAANAAGVVFALVTTPGPLVHNSLVGGGTAGADLATRLFGVDTAVAERATAHHSALSECLAQLAVGLPTYVGVAHLVLAVASLRLLARQSRRPLQRNEEP